MANTLRSILGSELAPVSDFQIYRGAASTITVPNCTAPEATLTSTLSATWENLVSVASGNGVIQLLMFAVTTYPASGNMSVRVNIGGVTITTYTTIFNSNTYQNRWVAIIGNFTTDSGRAASGLSYGQVPFEGGWALQVQTSVVTSRTWKAYYKYYITA